MHKTEPSVEGGSQGRKIECEEKREWFEQRQRGLSKAREAGEENEAEQGFTALSGAIELCGWLKERALRSLARRSSMASLKLEMARATMAHCTARRTVFRSRVTVP